MATVTYGIRGTTCGACVRELESALGAIPGVASAQVDLAQATTSVVGESAVTDDQLRAAIAEAGYFLRPAPGRQPPGRQPVRRAFAQPLVTGPLATLALLGLYLGLITLAQGWDHALEQFEIDVWFVLALSAGFGIQMGLFTYLRTLHAGMASGEVGMAASTGTSTVAMLACCAHHVSDVLPILGVSGAAVFLGAYQTPLLWVGIVMNLAGIAYLLWQLRGLRAAPVVSASHRQAAPERAPGH